MLTRLKVPFGEYLPDLPAFENPGATVANNVIPEATGYRPLPTQSVISSDAMDARCRGAIAAKDKSGAIYSYVGNASKLYVYSSSAHTDKSKVGGYTTTEFWEFVKWGEKIIATNYADAVQIITMGGANFADLGGSPPKARHIAVVREFVVLGNVDDGTAKPNLVQWSGTGNEATWAASASTLADSQELIADGPYGGGAIQAIKGGEYGVIFQEYAIWRMSFIGSPLVFQFDQVHSGMGTPARNSPVQIGDTIYFLGQDGWYRIDGGQTVTPIGANKVDRTFWDSVDKTSMDRIIGAADPLNRFVIWIYPGEQSVSGTPNKAMIFDTVTNRWATGDVSAEWVFSGLGIGYDLDGLDAVFADIDVAGISVDDRAFMGGGLLLNGYSTAHYRTAFSGQSGTCTVETTELQAGEERALVNGVRPIVDGGSVTIHPGKRTTQADAYSFGNSYSPNTRTGTANFRSDSRYHRFRATITGTWTHAQGLEVMTVGTGKQ